MFDDLCARVVGLRERLRKSDGFIRSIVEDLCAPLGPSLSSLVENFCADHNKSVSKAFRIGSIGSQCYDAAAISGIKICFSKGAALDESDGFTKGEDVSDSMLTPR